MSDVPNCVTPGWESIVLVEQRHINDGLPQPSKAIVFYPDGRAAFRHICDRGERGVIICAPFLRLGEGHSIVSKFPLTIQPSILCPDCGTHGFVTESLWRPA